MFIIKIEDNGVGLEESSSKEFPNSTGLGLDIVEQLTNKLGITFSIEEINEGGKTGTISTLVFPERNRSQRLTRSTIRILLAEDNLEMQEYLQSILFDYEVNVVGNGQEAWQHLQNEPFDVLVTDYMMPVMDGEELIKKIKSSGIDIPILVLSAMSDEKKQQNIMRLGIDRYITKPFSKDELIGGIEQAVALKKLINRESEFENKFDDEENRLTDEENKLALKEETRSVSEASIRFNEQLNSFIYEKMNDHHFSIELIADHFKISRSTLHRRVRSILGQTPNQIVLEARLQRAKDVLIENPFATDVFVAEAVGLKNSTYLFEQMELRFGKSFLAEIRV